MNDISRRAKIIADRIELLGRIGQDTDGLTRLFGSQAHLMANNTVINWMQEANLSARCDHIGNVRARLTGGMISKGVFVMGSHLDTVRNAGKYDGTLGVLLALDAAERLSKAGIELPFDLEIIGFADEEGVRFNLAYLGSSVLTGHFDPAWLECRDEEGHTLATAIEQIGGSILGIRGDYIAPGRWLGYFEVHIEQGPVLYERQIPVGIVRAIAGQARINIELTGQAAHAGTTPMDMRRDALAAAAEFISSVESYAGKKKRELVATVGSLQVYPNAANVVPAAVKCTLDLRSHLNFVMFDALQYLENKLQQIAGSRGITAHWKVNQVNPSVECDAHLQEILKKAIKQADIAPVLRLPSGAGHDAVAVSKVAPVSMLFVQCKNGISHHPEEEVTLQNIETCIQVCDHFMDELIKYYKKNDI